MRLQSTGEEIQRNLDKPNNKFNAVSSISSIMFLDFLNVILSPGVGHIVTL